jgi:hypothetical protein
LEGINDSLIEYNTDTTRAMTKLLFTGMAGRFPRIRFIFSHGGGTFPYLVGRFLRAYSRASAEIQASMPGGLLAALNRFFYDTANSAQPYTMASFTKVISMSHILFGTDYPYATATEIIRGLAGCGLSDETILALRPCGAGPSQWLVTGDPRSGRTSRTTRTREAHHESEVPRQAEQDADRGVAAIGAQRAVPGVGGEDRQQDLWVRDVPAHHHRGEERQTAHGATPVPEGRKALRDRRVSRRVADAPGVVREPDEESGCDRAGRAGCDEGARAESEPAGEGAALAGLTKFYEGT